MYVQGICGGIQALHATTELLTENFSNEQKTEKVLNWAKFHKTAVVLNGGDVSQLWILENFLMQSDSIPYAIFQEEGLGGTLTSIALVVSSEFDVARKFLFDRTYTTKVCELEDGSNCVKLEFEQKFGKRKKVEVTLDKDEFNLIYKIGKMKTLW